MEHCSFGLLDVSLKVIRMLRSRLFGLGLLSMVMGHSTVMAQFGPIERISPIAVGVECSVPTDIDGDGDMDVIAYSSVDGHITWFQNDGSGRFNDYQVIIELEPDKYMIAVGDMNNDGHDDIIVGKGRYGSFPNRVFYNNGDASFTGVALTTTSTAQSERTPIIADFDNDGLLDIIIASTGYWYRNMAGEAFDGPMALPINGESLRMVGDVNGDGVLDFFTHMDMVTSVHLSNGSYDAGHTALSLPISHSTEVHALGDMDNDGDMDLIIERPMPDQLSRIAWLENDGAGVFSNLHVMTDTHDEHFQSISAINLDSTPEPEILPIGWPVRSYRPDSLSNVNPSILFANGPTYADHAHFADFNGDGDLDMLFSYCLDVVFGNGTAEGWTEAISLNNLNLVRDFELVDMDKDGLEDIVGNSLFDSNSIQVLHYEGNGSYSRRAEQVVFGSPYSYDDIHIRDFNDDELMDVGYFSWWNKEFNCALNWGGGNWEVQNLLMEEGTDHVHLAAFEDFDGDGDLDVLQVPYQLSGDGIIFQRNNDGVFSPEYVGPTHFGLMAIIESADMDGDGDMDVIVAMRGDNIDNVNSGLLLLLNDGTGAFSYQFFDYGPTWFEMDMSIDDLDHDGDQDVLITDGSNNSLVIVFEFINETLVPQVIDQGNVLRPHVSHLMDVDNDGWDDLVCFTRQLYDDVPSGLFWYRNLGGLEFETPFHQSFPPSENTILPYTTTVYMPYDMESIDRDNDGDYDLFISDHGGAMNLGSIYYLENLLWGSYRITGNLFLDTDTSGTLDPDDQPFPFVAVQVDPSESAYYTNALGVYNAIVGEGTCTVYPELDEELWTLTTPSSYTVTLDSSNTLETDIDFGVIPNGVQPGGNLEIMDPSVICNTMGWMWFSLQNTGNTILSGVVEVTLDPLIDMSTVTSEADSVVGQTLYFTVDSLYYYDLYQWLIGADMPNEQNIGVPIASHAVYTDVTGLVLESENASELLCAYDPNDKKESTGVGPEGVIEDGQWLRYTVRFQNTGNAPATDVVIRDGLSTHLDLSTFTPVSWSHDVETSVEPSGDLVLRFENIMLPDSGSDMAASQGYFCYRIKANTGLMPGTRILNTARIFFDNNPPIITNTTSNMVECYEIGEHVIVQDSLRLISPFGNPIGQQWFLNGEAIEGAVWGALQPMVEGIYHVEAVFPIDCKMNSEPFQFDITGIAGAESQTALIYPNPATKAFSVEMSGPVGDGAMLVVSDVTGRVLNRTAVFRSTTVLSTEWLPSGVLLVHLEQGSMRTFLGKVVVMSE